MIRYGRLLASISAISLVGCSNASQLQLAVLNASVQSPDPVVDVYARIAQGAMACWFGGSGFLKTTHIFYADVGAPSSGRGGEIVIHEKDTTQPQPWGRRAFRIRIASADGVTTVEAENVAMSDDVAGRMRADVFQWAQGNPGCGPQGPSAAPAAPLPARTWHKMAPGSETALTRGS